MKKIWTFITRAFAVLGFMVFLVSALGWSALLFREKPHLPDEIVIGLDFTKDVSENPNSSPIKSVLGKEGNMSLRDMITVIDWAAKDPRVKVILGNFRENMVSMAAAQELREAVYHLRETGKKSYAFATSYGEFGGADKAYYLASAFEHVWLQPMGLVGITGLAAQSPFVRGALDKIGAKADFLHREQYKSAMDMLTEHDFTSANSEMLNSILDELTTQMIEDIAGDRRISQQRLIDLVNHAPISAAEAEKNGLITHIGYSDELDDAIEAVTGEKAEVVTAEDYLSLRRQELVAISNKGKEEKPTVAFIHATGEISQSADGPQNSNHISADDMVSALEDAAEDPKVEAILIRLDTPGGSAIASESIRRAVQKVQEAGIPVVASMGEVAGSGGYWVASQSDVIFADPATLTGSIGVIAGKVAATDELWDKLGIRWGMIKRGDNADMWSVTKPFSEAQRAKIDTLIDETYQQFKRNVALNRDLTPEQVAAIAKGRVWTGSQAFELGLVDETGGLKDAITYTKSLLGLPEDESIMLKPFPAPEPFAARLVKFIEGFGGIGASMGRATQMLDQLDALMQPLTASVRAKPGAAVMQMPIVR